jgi:hypothetical protein
MNFLLPFNIAKYNHRPHLEYLQLIQLVEDQYRGRPEEYLMADLSIDEEAVSLFDPMYRYTLIGEQEAWQGLLMELRLGRAALHIYQQLVGKKSWPEDPNTLLANLPAKELIDPATGGSLQIVPNDTGEGLILRYPPLTYEDVFGETNPEDDLDQTLLEQEWTEEDMAYWNTGRSWQLAPEPLQWFEPDHDQPEGDGPAPGQSPAASLRAELLAEAKRLKAAKADLLANAPDPATATPEEIQAFRQKARQLKADLVAFKQRKDAIVQAARE